ncbi:MAG: paraquat-inducible protein A, partial [Burkholderiales bacterium]
ALAFGAVVVLTILATMSFDPRLIWDSARREERYGRAA